MKKWLSKISRSHQQIASLAVLILYWPFIFILTHIPIPNILLQQMHASDKALHFLVYFILICVLWFAVSPDRKVSFRNKKIWIILPILVFYAAADEWLQGCAAGRTRDFMDFVANLKGLMGGLVVIWLFSFWPAVMTASAASIITFVIAVKIQFTGQLAFIRPSFLIVSFGFLTFTWLVFLSLYFSIKPVGPAAARLKWLLLSEAGPVAFMLAVKLTSQIAGRAFELEDIVISCAAISSVVAAGYLTKK
jgi:VanZ family protein